MKVKNIFVSMVALGLILVFSGIALANDSFGYIDPQKILTAHPKYQEAQKKLEQFAQKKADTAKKAVDQEKDTKKKMEIYESARRDSGNEEKRIMNPIMQEINDAIAKVCKQKSITVVLNKSLVFFGGVDLTQDVIKLIKK